jgi:hypothetical protein
VTRREAQLPATWPLVINQDAIALPHWPRSQQWWDDFAPLWCTASVRPDGTVALDVNGTRADGTRTEMDRAATRRQRQALTRWLHSTLPEAFPELYGTVTRNERGAITAVSTAQDPPARTPGPRAQGADRAAPAR